MATRTVPFCLEMLTFLPPRELRRTPEAPDAGRGHGHSHSAFLLGNAYIWPPRELWRTSETQLRHTSAIPGRGEGVWPLAQWLLGRKCLQEWRITDSERSGHTPDGPWGHS